MDEMYTLRFQESQRSQNQGMKNLLESELREIVINDSHVGWSLHPLLYRLSHHCCKSGPLFSSTWFSDFQLNVEHRSSSLNAGRGGTELFPSAPAGHSCPLILSSAGTSAIQKKLGRNYKRLSSRILQCQKKAQLPANTIICPVRLPFRERPFSQEEITKGFRLGYWNTKKISLPP